MNKQSNILDQLHHLLAVSVENEVVEFKQAKNTFNFDDIGKYFSALANEANLKGHKAAWLIFGVTDDRNIVGTNFHPQPKNLHSLKHEIAKLTTDSLSFIEIHEVRVEGKRVVLFEIPAAPPATPVAFKRVWYGRDGESLVPLSLQKLERIRAQKKFTDWSAETVVDATLDDLDPDAMRVARENFKKKNPRLASEMDAWDDATFLRNAKLTNRGKLTRSAILLLGNNQAELLLGGDPKIRWILKDHTGADKDYEIFGLPWLLAVDKVFAKIRNIKYRYMQSGTLFPQEVDMYDPFSIREALNNCIAHQDYTLQGRINVIEREDSLQFTNLGDFLPGDVQDVLLQDIAPERYRNTLLVEAMRNLNLVDTIGSGIRKMFQAQRERLFPMPEYDFANNRVSLTLIGKVLDVAYAEMLAANTDLSLREILVLDKVQKHKPLTGDEAKRLKAKKLIEGRKPNYYFAKAVAQKIGQKAEYTRNAPFEKQYFFDLIKKLLAEHKSASRQDIDKLLWDKLPDWMTGAQRKSKITNIISEMRMSNVIYNSGTDGKPCWTLKV
ncbi:MAG: putative DNA binding domain-containing protein [Deltaproteobacteria bacterium]|jgi:ATP-dependent DNA helicase RecG|nr:putative DNA binding domain-containing protein [Deltaproteobacteria bacterium]